MDAEKGEVVITSDSELWLDCGIVHVRYTEDRITIDDMKEHMQVAIEFANRVEGKATILEDLASVKSIERDARVYGSQIETTQFTKFALVFNNPVQRLMATFATGLQ